MGLQLGINESSNIIMRAIKATGENLNSDFHHVYSAPGNQGFYTEISDFTIARKLNNITDDYYKEDHTFSLNIPYEYFNDDPLSDDAQLGIKLTDHTEVKAEIRCMNLIAKTYEAWIKDHEIFTTKDLQMVINEALSKLWQNKKISLQVKGNGNEFAEKYVHIWFTWSELEAWAISTGNNSSANSQFFDIIFNLRDYYTDIGNHVADILIGEKVLRGKNRHDICLLRVAYLIYTKSISFIKKKYPGFYAKYKNGEL